MHSGIRFREALGQGHRTLTQTGSDTSGATNYWASILGMFVERHDVRNLHAYADTAINEVEELVKEP